MRVHGEDLRYQGEDLSVQREDMRVRGDDMRVQGRDLMFNSKIDLNPWVSCFLGDETGCDGRDLIKKHVLLFVFLHMNSEIEQTT